MAIPVVTKIKNWLDSRRLARLEKDLNSLKNRLTFNPKYAYAISDTNTEERYTRRLEEYRAWFIGDSRMLRELYRKQVKDNELNYFWYKTPVGWRMCHCGIPGLISRKMSTIIFGSGYENECIVYNDDNTVNEEQSETLKEHLEYIKQKTKIKDILDEGAQTESWSGHCFVKLSYDLSLSNYPIVEVASPRNAEVIKNRGITSAIVFKFWYKYNKKEYRMDEIYTTNNDGDATIYYKLYQLNANGTEQEVPLFSIPDTTDLATVVDDENKVVFKGLKGMLAFEKANLKPSHEFNESPYGASDYEGGIDSFDALDEIYTEIINEARNNKTIRMTPDTMIPILETGVSDGRRFVDEKFITNFMIVTGDPDQNSKDIPTAIQIDDKTEQHKIKFTTVLTNVINNAGLSPFALGITGLESINQSAESQQERNKVTIETRNKKCDLWQDFLQDFLLQLVVFNSWIVKNTGVRQEGFIGQDIRFDNCDIRVVFNDYLLNSQKELIDMWLPMMNISAISLERFVELTNPDMTKEQILEEVNRIRFEKGMAIDTPIPLPELEIIPEEE